MSGPNPNPKPRPGPDPVRPDPNKPDPNKPDRDPKKTRFLETFGMKVSQRMDEELLGHGLESNFSVEGMEGGGLFEPFTLEGNIAIFRVLDMDPNLDYAVLTL